MEYHLQTNICILSVFARIQAIYYFIIRLGISIDYDAASSNCETFANGVLGRWIGGHQASFELSEMIHVDISRCLKELSRLGPWLSRK